MFLFLTEAAVYLNADNCYLFFSDTIERAKIKVTDVRFMKKSKRVENP